MFARKFLRPYRSALLSALIALVAAAPAAVAEPTPFADARAAGHSSAGYWTKPRMALAIPASLTRIGADARRPARDAAIGRPGSIPGRPPSAGPAGAASRGVIGPVAEPTAYPDSAVGKLFFRQGRGDYVCSASVVPSSSRSVVMTAGHCLHDLGAGFSRRILFVPAFSEGAAPYGRWGWSAAVVTNQWARRASYAHDYGFVKLERSGGRRVADVVGSLGLAWSQPPAAPYRAVGYPNNLGAGERMWNCLSGLAKRDFTEGPPAPIGIDCRMGGGASGGPWIVAGPDGPHVASVTSYAYTGERILYGPYLTPAVNELLRRANRG